MSEQLVPMKPQVYKDPRPAEYFDRFHERARTREPDAVYEAVRAITSLYAWTLLRARCIGSENVPPAGPVIIAPNHFSFMDHFLVGAFVRRKVRFMAKSQLFAPPMQWIYTHGGVFPVRRGHGDQEAFTTALSIIAREDALAMYCEGGRSRTANLSQAVRPGIGRLALATGAPVVPVAIHGSQRVRNWKRLQFPKVTVQYGEPVVYPRTESAGREQWQAVADDIFGRIKRLYAGLEQHGRRTVAQRVREQRRASGRAPKVAA
jgi:1-acyl-sn-glycerol-3-phosphate acyltransferase